MTTTPSAEQQAALDLNEVIAELADISDRKAALAERETLLKQAVRDSGITDWTSPSGLKLSVTQSRSLTEDIAKTLLSPDNFGRCFETRFSPGQARKYVSDDEFNQHAVACTKPAVKIT